MVTRDDVLEASESFARAELDFLVDKISFDDL